MNYTGLFKKWAKELESRKQEGLHRELKQVSKKIDLSSNDYLGLARSEELRDRVTAAYASSGKVNKLGSTGSRLISGNDHFFEETESILAEIHQAESALLFNAGYMANVAVFSAFPKKGDTVLYDELCHASIKDGIRLSMAERFPFLHNDLNSLENKLKKAKGQIYVAVESIYSMDGDFAPLKEMAQLCDRYQALLIVDEAHSTGIIGEKGAGLVSELGLQEQIGIRIHTFGKAMGCHGAVVVGPKEAKSYLINFARPFIYTTAMSLHGVLSIRESYLYLAQNISLQANLRDRIRFFNKHIPLSIPRIESQSAIHALLFNGNEYAKKVACNLQENGFDVRPILSPTVKKGAERLRICLHTYNTEEEIILLASSLKNLI